MIMPDYNGRKENNSQSVVWSDLVFLSGATAAQKTGSIVDQTRQVLAAIDDRLAQVGSDKRHVLMSTVFISDLSLKEEMNRIWIEWIDPERPPARTCVGAELTPGTLIEVNLIACRRTQDAD